MFDNDVPFDTTEDFKEDADVLSELYEQDYQNGPIDAVTANYYVGIVKKNKEKEATYKEQAKTMIEDFKYRVESWLAKRLRALEYSSEMCLGKLEAYYNENGPANGKPLSLPEGNIGFYSVQENFDFDSNAKELISILEQSEDTKQFVRYKAEINKKDLKKSCTVHDDKVYIGDVLLPKVAYSPKTKRFGTR